MRTRPLCLAVALVAAALAMPAQGRSPELTEVQKRKLDQNFDLCLKKRKGPYSANYCVCRNGQKKPVWVNGKVVSPCGGAARFCAAFREPWAQALADEGGMYIGNLFSRDLFQWDEFPDHHDLVRGYVLEKFFIETHPEHKLAVMRAYGGLAGAEFEARDAPRFFERYLDLESFGEPRHYLLAYELQRRFFVRGDQGAIGKARNLASAVQRQRADFKPLRDAVHNQISAAQIPRIRAYRDAMPAGKARDQVDELIAEMKKLTSLDESALREQLPGIEDEGVRSDLEKRLPQEGAEPLASIQALAGLMVSARQTVEARQVSPADRRRLVDLAITAAAVIQQRGMALVDAELTVRQHLELLLALVDAAYGSGLLMERERTAATASLQALLQGGDPSRDEFQERLAEAARVVEWAQRTTLYAFEEVTPTWLHLLPDVRLLPDDVLRGSPLLVYGRALQELEDHATGADPIRHDIFGKSLERDVRALNPGLALGKLRVDPEHGSYSRVEVLALPETPAELEPAAGILTRGEGNVVSHVQLLARALGIPNTVLGPSPYELFAPNDGKPVFYIATPGGRVIVKTEASMTDQDREVLAEYTRNQERTDDGALGDGGPKLHIDVERLDVGSSDVIDLASMRRKDSGVRGGPKAAFLGELKHHFPDKVARGVVVPFGAYYAHYQAAPVAVPIALKGKGVAKAGGPLEDFVTRTYATFFDEKVGSGASERELADWIRPRLDVIRYSIESHPLSAELREQIRAELERQGLLLPDDPKQTVGLFVRSDTNVEDLDDFNGAGLNLTLFNRRSLSDVYAALKEVWASPFTYRSFSWRQTLIDEPLWVLPSVVVLESVPTEKSGVLVTADLDGADRKKMLIATSEGVGGAVDGTPAETIVWSPQGVELVTMFKSPYRRLLLPEGGSKILPSTGSETVLSDAEVKELVRTAARIRDEFEPSIDSAGNPRPWDIEFGFADGKLWLFQTRPFIGNQSLANVPALAAYEPKKSKASKRISLDDVVR
ncbi:MAG: PEP/pyruvate-binding domain-containing protein [Myxococcota bacterium]|nr:PEP/pyruvate-binding domain-containing protein [Myxococcota bacterium]